MFINNFSLKFVGNMWTRSRTIATHFFDWEYIYKARITCGFGCFLVLFSWRDSEDAGVEDVIFLWKCESEGVTGDKNVGTETSVWFVVAGRRILVFLVPVLLSLCMDIHLVAIFLKSAQHLAIKFSYTQLFKYLFYDLFKFISRSGSTQNPAQYFLATNVTLPAFQSCVVSKFRGVFVFPRFVVKNEGTKKIPPLCSGRL